MTHFLQRAVIAMLMLLTGVAVSAQTPSRLELLLTRPDAVPETLTGRLDQGDEVTVPPADSVRGCGPVQIALTRVSYSFSSLAHFNYYFSLRAPNQAWQQWLVTRPDIGRFTPVRLDDVKVVVADGPPACADFQLPLYCLTSCTEGNWWEAQNPDTLKRVSYFLGSRAPWELRVKRALPFPATFSDPQLEFENDQLWNSTITLDAERSVAERRVMIDIWPKVSWALVSIWLTRDTFGASLRYQSEVKDALTAGIGMAGRLPLTLTLKPAWWLLAVSLVVGTVLALLLRRLAWNNVKEPWREWALTVVVGGIILAMTYVTGAAVELGSIRVTSDGLTGAAVVGLSTGLAGRRAIDRIYDLFGVKRP